MYEYKAVLRDIYDGDTITVDIDLGFGIWMRKQKVRLFGIDTPELRGPRAQPELAKRARDRVVELIGMDNEFLLRSHKDRKGKYGRWLGVCVSSFDINVNRQLVADGLAREVNYD